MSEIKIAILDQVTAVRRRPGMYIGPPDDTGLHGLLFSVVEQSLEERVAGFGRRIDLALLDNNILSLLDDGLVLSTAAAPGSDMRVCERRVTTFGASQHGDSLPIANALSETLEVDIFENGRQWRQRFERGVKVTELTVGGRAEQRGTRLVIKPDKRIFGVSRFDFDRLSARLQELAFLHAGVTLTVKEEASGRRARWHYEEGLTSFVREVAADGPVIHPAPISMRHIDDSVWFTSAEVAVQFTDFASPRIHTFVNSRRTREGVHLTGFETGLERAVTRFCAQQEVPYRAEDTKLGYVAVVSVKQASPVFDGATRERLISPDVAGIVADLVEEHVLAFLEQRASFDRSLALRLVGRAD